MSASVILFSVFFKAVPFHAGRFAAKGYTKATLGVEPSEKKNKEIYAHYGFTEFLRSGRERYPDGTEIEVESYGKPLK